MTNPPHQEATNPNTKPERLTQLAKLTKHAPHVAANPNTPTSLLLKLAHHYPDQVLNNPAFHLTLVTDPTTPTRLTDQALHQLTQRKHAPQLLHQEKRERTKQPPKPNTPTNTTPTPLEVLTGLIKEAGGDWTEVGSDWLAAPGLTTVELLEHVVDAFTRNGQLQDGRPLESLVHNPSVPEHLLQRLLDHPDAGTRRAAALHPNLTPATLFSTAKHAIRQGELSHAASLLTNLAARPDTPATQLTWLLNWCHKHQHGNVGISLYLAGNPNTPATALEELYELAAHTGNNTLLQGLASNPQLPQHLAEQLVTHKSESVRKALAVNTARLPEHLQETLLTDTIEVRETAAQNTNHPGHINQLINSSTAIHRRWAASNPHLTNEQAQQLRDDSDAHVRHALNNNPNVPLASLNASSPNLTTNQGEQLLRLLETTLEENPDDKQAGQTADALANNKKQPHGTRLAAASILTETLYYRNTRRLHDHTPHATPETLFIAIINDNTSSQAAHAHTLPPEHLNSWQVEHLAHHHDWRVRFILANRQHLPEHVKRILEQDDHPAVRATLEGCVVA